jgi:hypothetical protein
LIHECVGGNRSQGCKVRCASNHLIAVIVYRKLGLKILRRSWINFDLIWAAALLVVGATALYFAFTSAA